VTLGTGGGIPVIAIGHDGGEDILALLIDLVQGPAASREVVLAGGGAMVITPGRQVWNRQRTDTELADPANVTLGHKSVQRWNLPDGWVISSRPAHPALVSEDDFVAAQDINTARRPRTPQDEPVMRRYLLAGLLACGLCGRRMESAWSNGKAAHRCRHERDGAGPVAAEERLHPRGQAAAAPARPAPAAHQPRHARQVAASTGADVRSTVSPGEVVGSLREHEVTLTWNRAPRRCRRAPPGLPRPSP